MSPQLSVRIALLMFALAACNGGVRGTVPAAANVTGAGYSRTVGPDGAPLLYIANREGNQVLGFKQTASGNVAPTVMISGSNTQLNLPVSIAIDASERIYVANDGDSKVLTYAAGADGNVAPSAVISGTEDEVGRY